MPRYAIKVEYNGAPFAGWQRQSDQPSVQGAIETALAKLEPRAHTIAAAGRTDAGVHATGQVAHCDMAGDWSPFRLSEALNWHLKPQPVAITACSLVADDWHARFSAVERRYMFRLVSRRAPLVHDAGLAWHIRHDLDPIAMQAGADRLIGRHDFTTFRSTACQSASPVKSLERLNVRREGQHVIVEAAALSFLHHQVRSMVGCLVAVGLGRWTAHDLQAALDAADRCALAENAPPEGLYFVRAIYP